MMTAKNNQLLNNDLIGKIFSYKKPKEIMNLLYISKEMNKFVKLSYKNLIQKYIQSTFYNKKDLQTALYDYIQNNNKDTYLLIEDWNVSNVVDMSELFRNMSKFNEPIGNWNVSKVTNMSYMFCEANEFNQPIGNWNVSKCD